jgi:uncharacterized protein YndB with AHSA1/START domain
MDGTYERIDDRPALRFERRLAHPVDAVWRAITEPSELAHWFPNEVKVDLRVGGRMGFTFPQGDYPPMEGEVLELDPPRRLAFTWGDDELRFELEPIDEGRGCLLRFTDLIEERDKAARDAAGWHVCLDRMEHHLAGELALAPDSSATGEWREHYERYSASGLPTGAPLPG